MTVGRDVLLVAVGGTIARLGRDPLDFHEYADTGRILTARELLDAVPSAHAARVRPVDFAGASSADMDNAGLLRLRTMVAEGLASEQVAGAVVTHGTATLEETAYFLHLTLPGHKPVVLVGGQRPMNGLSSDAPLNLLHALTVARQAPGLGVVVVMNCEIHNAREVTKADTYALQAFHSPRSGPLGYITADQRVLLNRRPTRRSGTFPMTGVTKLPTVDIAYGYQGSDGAAISAYVDRGADAVVVAGLAPGVLTPGEWRAVARARAAGVTVVLSSRAGSGPVVRTRRLAAEGVLAAGDLNPQKARILTMVALTATRDPDRISGYFDEY